MRTLVIHVYCLGHLYKIVFFGLHLFIDATVNIN